MRNLKKLVALIVTIAMIATFAIPAFAAAPADVVGTSCEGAVTRLVSLGVINGYPDGTFGPNDSITRAQFAAIVVRSLGYESLADTAKGLTAFSDVAATYWGAGYINIAVGLKIIKGYGDGTFGPEDKVTYDQAVTMIVRALGQEAYAEAKGGFPTGYLLQANVIGFTSGVTGVAGIATTRGAVAQLIDNAKDDPIYVQTGFGDSQTYEATGGTFLDKLGMDLVADDAIVTETPASAGLDANTFVANTIVDDAVVSTTYTAAAGAVDIESLLGKKVDLWGSSASNIVLAENVTGTAVAVASITGVAGDVVSATLADGTAVDYTIVAGAGAMENLEVAAIADVVAAIKDAGSDMTQTQFIADGTNLQFVNAIVYDTVAVGAAATVNNVTKNIKLGAYDLEKDGTSIAKTLIVKDGVTVDYSAIAAGDILFVAFENQANADVSDDILIIKATNKTVTGTVQAAKPSGAAATSFEVGGVWYTPAAATIDVVDELGKDVTLTLDPAGKVYSLALVTTDDTVSADQYGVVTDEGSLTDAFGNTTYSIKLMNSAGDVVTYVVSATVRDYAEGDLVAYHVADDGTIDTISNDATLASTAAINTTRSTFGTVDINSSVVIFEEVGGDLGTLTLAGVESGENATADYITNSSGVIVAMLVSAYVAPEGSVTEGKYAYATDYTALPDGIFAIDMITVDGAVTLNTVADSVYDYAAAGSIIKYDIDSNNSINIKDDSVDSTAGEVTYADSSRIKVDGVSYWFTDTSLIIYDDGTTVDTLTKTDFYVNMLVKVVADDDNNIIAVVVTEM